MNSALEILNAKLQGTDTPPTVIALALDEAGQLIKNYCNREFVPWQLNYTWANMALDIIKGRYPQAGSAGMPDSEIGSIKAGDMTVTRSAEFVAHKVNVDTLCATYAGELNNFRTFRWGI